jgi:murein DD-endopeptidase
MLALSAATAAACASTGAVPRPFPTPDRPSAGRAAPPVPAPPPAPGDALPAGPLEGHAIADTALSLRGVPYRLGGANPAGFDCSGLVQYVLGRHGVSVPRVVTEQFRIGQEVRGDLQPGDLVFFGVGSRRASHVGIAIGGDEFVHAPATGQSVRVDSLTASYWRDRYAGSRRVTPTP